MDLFCFQRKNFLWGIPETFVEFSVVSRVSVFQACIMDPKSNYEEVRFFTNVSLSVRLPISFCSVDHISCITTAPEEAGLFSTSSAMIGFYILFVYSCYLACDATHCTVANFNGALLLILYRGYVAGKQES